MEESRSPWTKNEPDGHNGAGDAPGDVGGSFTFPPAALAVEIISGIAAGAALTYISALAVFMGIFILYPDPRRTGFGLALIVSPAILSFALAAG